MPSLKARNCIPKASFCIPHPVKNEELYTRIVDFREDWGPMGELQVEKVYKSSLLAKSIRIFVFREMESQLNREKFPKVENIAVILYQQYSYC